LREHPTPAELDAFVEGKLPPRRFWTTARHILRGCVSCRGLLKFRYKSLLPSSASNPLPDSSTPPAQAFDAVFSAFRSHRRYLRREDIRQRKFAATLQADEGLEVLLRGSEPPVRGLGALKALLDRSWAVRHENLEQMKGFARVAVEVARRLDWRWHDEQDAADWQARAWAEWGNALRASDDLDGAERAFGFAFDFFLQGTRDPHLKARIHDLHASYLGTRRQFELAITALDIVYSIYLELGDSHLAGKALAAKAMYLHYDSQSERALTINQQAMSLIDKDRDASLLPFSIHNQIWFLVACGRFLEARTELFRHLREFQAIDGRIYQLRLRWLQAQISAGLRKWESAEEGLLHVKEGFEKEGMGFHSALASLDLALVWMQQDLLEKIEPIVIEACEVFIALRIQREAFGSIMILKEAFARQMGTVKLLETTLDYLHRGNAFPSVRF
jgi:tetratricopeptide (TPR) repeat protein